MCFLFPSLPTAKFKVSMSLGWVMSRFEKNCVSPGLDSRKKILGSQFGYENNLGSLELIRVLFFTKTMFFHLNSLRTTI